MRGGVFSKQLAGGRANAALRVNLERIEATTPGGEVLSVESDSCELELGGARGRMWFVRAPDRSLTLYSEGEDFAQALREHSILGPRVAELTRERARRMRNARLRWGAAIAVTGLLLSLAYLGVVSIAQSALRSVPPSVDKQLGVLAVKSMDLGGPVVGDLAVVRPVEKLVARLASGGGEHPFSFHVQVVRSDRVNAFALPGGEIVVYTGLLETADGPQQLAGVLAHEMAHVTRRHGVARMAQGVGLAAAVEIALGDVGGLSAIALDLAQAGALTSYGRDQEREADESAAQTLHAAGISPLALAEFFALLREHNDGAAGGEIAPELPDWLASHPDLSERIESARSIEASLGPRRERPIDIDWPGLQSRLVPKRGLNTVPPAGQDAAVPPGARENLHAD